MTMGMASAKMNYISQAITSERDQQQQRLGRAALGTGLGLVQSRGRGSAAAMQSGFYQDLAESYSQEGASYEALDFSFFIEEEKFQIAQEIERKRAKSAKKGGIGGAIGSLAGGALGAIFGGAPGAGIGASLGGGLGEAVGGWF